MSAMRNIPEHPTIEPKIVNDVTQTYTRLYNQFGFRPSIQFVTDQTLYPFDVVAAALLYSVANCNTEPEANGNEHTAKVVEWCNQFQTMPTIQGIKHICPGVTPIFRRAIMQWLDKHYVPLDPTARKILKFAKWHRDNRPNMPPMSPLGMSQSLSIDIATTEKVMLLLQERGLLA